MVIQALKRVAFVKKFIQGTSLNDITFRQYKDVNFKQYKTDLTLIRFFGSRISVAVTLRKTILSYCL